jgi:hypothetical protein
MVRRWGVHEVLVAGAVGAVEYGNTIASRPILGVLGTGGGHGCLEAIVAGVALSHLWIDAVRLSILAPPCSILHYSPS